MAPPRASPLVLALALVTFTEAQDPFCMPPTNPSNGKFDCVSDSFYQTCTATCNTGYQFADLQAQTERQCDLFTGDWFSGPDVTPCVPICNLPCLNGGTCSAPDRCDCPQGFSGPQCQSRTNPCDQPPSPRYGRITCQHQGDVVSCAVSCSPGFRFESPPSTSYRCTPDGTWTPAKETIPDCVQDFDTVIATTPPNGVVPTGSSVHPAAALGSMCVVWGQEHYRTFDNKVYTFSGQCTYTLVRDCQLNTFTVNVINDRNCAASAPCKREIDLFLGQTKVTLRQTSSGPAVTWDGTPLTIPTSRAGNVIEKIGNYLTIQSAVGFLLKWDGKESIFFRASEDLKGKTCGLCGVYDGNQANDFTTPDGTIATSPASFGVSWKKVDEAPCPDSSQSQTCDAATSTLADNRCSQIMSDPAFTPCHSAVDPSMYVEACKFDCCAQNQDSCTCKSMQAYSRACMDRGVTVHWRRNNRCPVQCDAGKVFQECGSTCALTCENPSQVCHDQSCVDGCFCPTGFLEHKGQCLEVAQCPCTSGGQTYNPGQTMQKDCNTCTCQAGKWACTTKTCEATCSATGDPHYMTFDKKRYDFMGTCSYYLLYDNNFSIVADNIQCGHGEAACTKSVTIDINGQNIKLDHNHQLFVNGREITQLPYEVPGIKVFMVSSLFMQAELSNGVKILWDGRTRVYVTAPTSFIGNTRGLCGTFDNNQNNDFLTRGGNVEPNANLFGNSWKREANCRDMPATVQPSPCDTNPQRKQQAQELCNKLRSDVFKTCHDVEAVDGYYDDCVYDMCACTENIQDCMCPAFGLYADTCATRGVKINWRMQITDCMLQCPGGQEYQVCGNPCERTCRNIAEGDTCQASCVEGCNCPDGQTLNDDGQCVDVSQCPCVFDGRQFPAGYTTLKGAEICTCMGARWSCARIQFDSNMPDTIQPLCPDHAEFRDCIIDCPRTCENMNDATPTCAPTASGSCKSGCACLDGYVLEGGACVNASMCPCYHGGQAFHEGDIIAMDCNQCTCRSRKWVCQQNDCPATCSAVGDSHYKTFDGKEYQFQGTCDYVLVKSPDGSATPFQVTTENVACGSSGVTCSRMIEITVGEPGTPSYYKLQLIRGQSAKPDPESPFTVREVGAFVLIDTPFGLHIQWDKGTRVYIRMSTEHRSKVEGLCGNFNGDQTDDFRGPTGGVPFGLATEFGDSWKVQSYCAPPIDVTNTCERTPQRQSWAQQQCGILASDMFAKCHAVEDYTKYMQRCVFDTCACNQGGDCECLCTAIAAYAHVCASLGVPIKWRSNDLCPMECEDCRTYSPCISACPKKTCDNLHTYAQLAKGCEDLSGTCFEGCDLQPCPTGQVYASLDAGTCIPEPLCDTPSCKLNGKVYRDGERVADPAVCNNDCEICNCRNGTLEHISYAFCQSLTGPTQGPRMDPPLNPGAEPMRVPVLDRQQNQKTTAGVNICGPGLVWQACLYRCDEVCDYLARSTGACDGSAPGQCVSGCRNSTVPHTLCAPGEKRVDAETCAPANMCPCLKPDGTMARPFETWKNPDDACSDCSCYNGFSLCSATDPSCSASPDATPTAAPQATPTCGWSQWMNTNTPTSGSGDVESLASLRTQFGLCDSPLQIECRDTVTRQPVSSGPGVTCDVQTGLTCSHAESGATCPDYEVRVYCPCTDLLTPAPDSTPTVTPRGMCLTRWSDWVNKDTPADGRDFEKLTVEELSRFCPGGKITAVQCFTADDIEYFSSGETVTCSLQDGLVCNNADNAPLSCSDYKIKYQCTCAPVINNDEGPTLKPPQDPPKCGWTAWLNSHTPSDVGEQETLTQLRQQFHVCATEDMTALECRPAGGQQEDSHVRAASVCDMRYSGFLCRHDDLPAGHSCPDYEVRFLCEPRELDCTGPTASPDKVPTHPPRFPSLNPTAAPERNQGRNVPEPTMPAYPVCADDMTNLVPLEIDNSQLRASSSLSLYTTAARSRLRTQQEGVFTGGWAAGGSAGEEWLEVKFPHAVTVAGVVTQGRDGYPNWVTEYTLMYSLDGMQYHYYTEQEGVPKVFQGNSDSSTEVPHTIQLITARFFIIKPVSWFGAVAMRLAFIGCEAVQVPTAIPTSQPVARPTAMPVPDIPDICVVEMGMMTGDIRDDMISASSFRDAAHAPHKARLGGPGSWLAARDDVNQYIQIDLLAPHYVTGVTTQGRGAAPSWVKSYRVLYSMDGVNWNVYREASGVDKVFTANTDSATPVTHLFQHPVRAQYVRINPLTWEGRIALRMELHGCFEPYPPGVAPGVPTAIPTAAPTVQPSSNIPDGCIKWDAWVDTHQPGLVSRDDSEPIARVLAESQTCADPLAIQCRTATIDHTPWELTGQPIRCNLWDGLVCNAADVSEPSCFNYEVRLGCLRQTAECLSHVPTGTPTSRPDAQPPVLPCYPGMDTTSCPLTCLSGQYCDGARCVSRAECPCVLEGRIVRARDVTTNGACETCQCLNGEIRCMAKTCTSCPQGVSMLNSVTCGCECVTCDVTQFQCDGGQCIPAASNCDGVIDCMNDELNCSNPAKFVPPSLRPTARPDATPSGSTTPAIQPVQRDTVTPPKEPRFEPTPRPPKRCPRHCPVPPQIVCPEDVDVVAVIGDCNCTTKACLAIPLPVTTPRSPQPVCRYQHTGEAEQVYQIGDTWTDGACSECTCISGAGGAGEISCQKQRCADCKMGESRVDQPGQCCGLCEAVGCMQDGRVYKVGEEMPTWRACYKKTCEMDQQQTTFYIRETQVTCPRIHTLQLCHDDANRYDAQGCCLICVPKTLMNNSTESCVPCTPQPVFTSPHESIGHFQVTTTGGATCHNRDPVSDLTQCVGSCASQATYTDLIRSYSSTCSCCQPGATRSRTVQLSCDDGSTLTHTYQVATECACGTCTNKQ